MQVRVALKENPYEVHVVPGGLANAGNTVVKALKAPASRAFLVVDAGVPRSLVDSVAASLLGHQLAVTKLAVTPGEDSKILGTLEKILVEMARSRHERQDPVIALGGGVAGDVAGFAAAVYRRGVPVIQCPTTLLAMVDASVGGKTGVNLDLGQHGGLKKNMVGAFWQPAAVIADVHALRSLPPREFRSGLAECIKHAILGKDIQDPYLLDWTRTNLPRIGSLEPDTLAELVLRNVTAKAWIVAGDEREEAEDHSGGRALLNLGHTFAHAIETLPGLFFQGLGSPVLHGEAVGLGLIAAATAAHTLHLAPPMFPAFVQSLIRDAGLPTAVQGLPQDDELMTRMTHDKKSRGGVLRLVLPTGDGHARVIADPPKEAIVAGFKAIRA